MRKWLILIICLAACTPTPPVSDVAALPTLAVLPTDVPLLIPWQAERGTLSGEGDVDEWRFVAQANDEITLRVVDKGVLPQMQLWFGAQLVSNGTAIETVLQDTGEYRVQVQLDNAGAGDYEIGLGYADNRDATPTNTPLPQVVGVPTPTPAYNALGSYQQALSESQEVGGRFTADEPEHVFTYDGMAGQIITLELSRLSGTLDPVLTLFDPEGNAMAMDDDSGNNTDARLSNIRLTQNGTYSVQAHGTGLFGEYLLRLRTDVQPLELLSFPTATATSVEPYITPTIGAADGDLRLQSHSPLIGSLARIGDFQRFSLFAEAGQRITLQVSPFNGSGIRPQFEIYGPEGTQVTSAMSSTSNAGGMAFVVGEVIEETGAYIIIVTGEDGTQGDFTISYGVGSSAVDVFQGEAQVNMQHNAHIIQRGHRHLWQVTLHPGDELSVSASPANNALNPVVEVVNAEGDVLFRDDDGGANGAALIRTAQITEPATYLFRVYDALGLNVGSYTLMWRLTANQQATPTSPPEEAAILTANDSLEENAYEFYVFQGHAGQTVRIQAIAQAGSPLDPVLVLLDPLGAEIALADDTDGSMNPTLVTTLPVDGTYTVRVNGYLSGGAYLVRVVELLEHP